MATATNQSILRGTIGRIGDIVMRTVNGKTVISKAPKRRTRKSEKEKANHSLFQQAAAFAVEVMRDPESKIYFKSVAKDRRLPNGYTAALSLKLQELNAQAKKQPDHQSIAFVDESVEVPPDVDETTYLGQIYHDNERIIGDALLTLSMAWRNLERRELDNKQKELSKTVMRAQIRQWLDFV